MFHIEIVHYHHHVILRNTSQFGTYFKLEERLSALKNCFSNLFTEGELSCICNVVLLDSINDAINLTGAQYW